MMRRLFFLILWLSACLGASAQTVQWAARVVGKSTEYGDRQYSAEQVLGIPNILPAFRESPCAWSPLNKVNRLDEFIHVEYRNPMRIKQIAIAESFNPGAISRVYVYDTQGKEYQVYKNDMPQPLAVDGRMFIIKVPYTSYQVKQVKLVLNTVSMQGWSHIDAIGISDGDLPIKAEINLVKDIKFEAQPQNLGSAVNTEYDEIMPIISPDGKSLYFDRKDHPENTQKIINDDIWFSVIGSTNKWTRAENIGGPLNNKGHNFLTAISPDGNTALLGNVYEADGTMSSGLSIAQRAREGWDFPKKLVIENYYNNNKFSEFHLGTDGKTIVMTVQRQDSYGGKDLYVSFAKPDGTWTEPRNMGPVVNSAATEMSPFLAADGKTLYFSSDGFSGYGNKDMYMTRRLDGSWTKWSQPQNLGPMINSANWDAYYSVPASGEYAYFSSENNSMGKTDIFRILLPEAMRPEPVVLIRGRVLDEKTKEPIKAKIIYELLSEGKEIGVANSNPKTGEYTIILPAGAKYGFLAQAAGYMSENQNIDLTEIKEYKEISQDLLLVPIRVGESVVLNNIFFSPSDADLKSDSKPELERVLKFMQENPTMKVEIGGHTNNACSEEYCMTLSTARAKAVYDYLIAKGANKAAIRYKGYGGSKPRWSNDNPEGLRKNRRVEFTILEI
jgi:outer membrane protein OmpA-like peptidoglycan-associated protein